jgi:hypothetical protein
MRGGQSSLLVATDPRRSHNLGSFEASKVLLVGGVMSEIDGHILIQFFENRIVG